jgi:transketolase
MTAMPQMKSAPDNRTLANAVRMLTIDAVEQAKSGHPGAPMGFADIAQVLWNRYLKQNPADPHWPDGDRFRAAWAAVEGNRGYATEANK